MSKEKLYIVQVDSTMKSSDMKKIADSLGGFLREPDATAMVVPETVEPLNKDEAEQYLEEMANALGKTVTDDKN